MRARVWRRPSSSAVIAARSRLAELAGARALTLENFSCTLVGCVASAGGGRFFHIGDGYAIYQGAAGDSVLSRPENGEYADETFFVTDEDWKDHLRFTPVPQPECGCVIGLMSDGTAPFAVNRERSALLPPLHRPDRRLPARRHAVRRRCGAAQPAGESACRRDLARRQDAGSCLRALSDVQGIRIDRQCRPMEISSKSSWSGPDM